MSNFHEELEWLCQGSLERAEIARLRLKKLGRDNVPLLLEALDVELRRDGEVRPLHYDYSGAVMGHLFPRSALRLAELLADLEDHRALPLLLRLDPALDEPALRLISALAAQDQPEVRDTLLSALNTLRTHRPFPRSGLAIARALLEIAERNPSPEFRAALPLLKPGLGAPLEFLGLHHRLKALLSQGNLPIPSGASPATEDLPIPSENEPL